MKKIVIVTKKMTMGGCEKALVSMLKNFPINKYKVTLLVMEDGGELYEDIPKWIEIKRIPDIPLSSKAIIKKYMKAGKLLQGSKSLVYLSMMRFKTYYEQYFYHSRALPIIEEEYDLAISYFAPCEYPDWYTINNIKAKKKVVWVHSDVVNFKGINNPLCYNMYSKYDKIFCVSKDACKSFIKIFPKLGYKVDLFYNSISKKEIALKGNINNGFDDDFDGVRILTVGRLSREKGQDLIPSILLQLKKDGYNVRWYCIGDGSLRKELELAIEENNLSGDVILLGVKTNPYPYMKQCDIYVQPSRYEAYCLTLCEARCFNKPIVTTDFVGAKEQIIDGKTGFIVKLDKKEIQKKIKKLIDNKSLREKFKKNLGNIDIDTSNEIKKLEDFVL